MVLPSELGAEHKSSIGGAVRIPLFCACLLVETSSIHAQESPEDPGDPLVELTWTAPEGCPKRSVFIAEIEELVGHPLRSIDKFSIKAAVTVRKEDDETWILRLRTQEQGSTGERELVADSCETLAQAAALILAMSIDPKAVETRERLYDQARRLTKHSQPSPPLRDTLEREQEATGEQNASPITQAPSEDAYQAPTPDRQDETQDEEEPAETSQLGFLFRSGLVADIGALPNASIGADVAAGIIIERVDLIVSMNWFSPNQAALVTFQELGARFGLWTVGIGAYYRVFKWEFSIAPYVIIDLGSMYGEGTGVAAPLEDSAFWLSTTAGIRVLWEFAHWAAMGFEIGPRVPFFRPRYVLEISGERTNIHRSSPVALCARLGFELRL